MSDEHHPSGSRDDTIRNRAALETDERRALALDAVAAGIEAADPGAAIRAAVSVDDGDLLFGAAGDGESGGDADDDSHADDRGTRDADRVPADAFDRILVVGGGKPAGEMARALDDLVPDAVPVAGVVVAPRAVDAGRVDVVAGSHPLPDAAGRDGAERLLAAAREADERTLVLAVVGGGGSALLPAPAGDLTLEDLRATTRAMLDAGAAIGAINAVRKHCSDLKGGQLAAAAAPARVVGLVASDVVGDDLATIASGPTAPDPTTYGDALDAADRFDVDLPTRVRAHLEAGAAGDRPETPTAEDPVFDRVSHHVVVNGRRAVGAAADRVAAAGYEPLVLTTRLQGAAAEVGRTLAAVAAECRATGDPVAPPAAVVAGGETTVDVADAGGDGAGGSDDGEAGDDREGGDDGTRDPDGGPNAELALGAALACDLSGWTLAAVDTDGRDGSTAHAGAIVDAGTVADAADDRAARGALSASDSYGYLRDRRGPIDTGTTGTNVNDLVVVLVD